MDPISAIILGLFGGAAIFFGTKQLRFFIKSRPSALQEVERARKDYDEAVRVSQLSWNKEHAARLDRAIIHRHTVEKEERGHPLRILITGMIIFMGLSFLVVAVLALIAP